MLTNSVDLAKTIKKEQILVNVEHFLLLIAKYYNNKSMLNIIITWIKIAGFSRIEIQKIQRLRVSQVRLDT